jgi:carboxymethylenebutenolidase
MRSSTLDIRAPDGVADAHLTRPDEDERHPGVLLVMDAFGLRRRIEEMADRISGRGYAEFFKAVRPLIDQLTPERVAADGGAYLDELAKVADEPFAITGYCMGARLGWRIAAAHPDRVAALAGFHGGGLVTDDAQSPHRSAGALRAEVYFGHADQDPSNSAEQIATLDAALDAAGARHRSEVYAGASHGYTMADTPVYDEQACERHFAALFDLLDRTLAR